jgi:uncharacterized protein YaaW (UPF0174 family)
VKLCLYIIFKTINDYWKDTEVKKSPNKQTLNYIKDSETNYLGEERKFYQNILEDKYVDYDFKLLNDLQLMNIYESLDHEQIDMLDEYFE